MKRVLSTVLNSLEVRVFAVLFLATLTFGGVFGYYLFASQQKEQLLSMQAELSAIGKREAATIRDRIDNLEQLGVRANQVLCSYLTNKALPDAAKDYPRGADGAVRFHSPDGSHAVFVSSKTEMTPKLAALLARSEAAWGSLGPLVTTRFLNFYFDTPSNTHVSTSTQWIDQLEPDHDFGGDIFRYIADPQHNPQRLPRWTPVYYDSIHRKWMTSLVVPVYCGGEFEGTTGSDFALDAVFATVQQLYLREGLGKAFLFDDDGNIVVHPDYMEAIHLKHSTMNARLRFDEISDPAVVEFLKSYRPTINAELAGIYGADGNRLVIAAHAVGALGWHLAFYESEARLVQPLHELRLRIIGLASVTALLLTLVLHWALSRFVFSRIRGLSLVAAEVGRGKLDTKLLAPIRGPHDAIGEVVRAFERMIDDLKGLTSRLSSEVQRLDASQRNYRAILDGANDAIFVHELTTGQIIDVNAKVTELYGYSRDEAAQLAVSELSSGVEPYTGKRFVEWLKRARAGDPQLFEWQAKSRSGRSFWVEVNMRLADVNGEQRVLVSVRDISARRKAEEDLRATRSYLRYIFDSLPSVLIAFERSGAITQWNRAASELTHIGEQAAQGRLLWDVVPALRKYEATVNQLLAGIPIPTQKAWELIHENRHCLLLSFLALPEQAYGDVVLRMEDVTELERKEELLRRAQRMDSVGMLAGGLAHDFNNSLGCITAMLSSWRRKLSEAEPIDSHLLHEDITTMCEASARAADTVRQLMMLSRQQELSLQLVDLNHVVREVAELCKRGLHRSVTVEFRAFPGPAMAFANFTELQQVLLNLSINAADAMTMMRKPNERWGGTLQIVIEKQPAAQIAFVGGVEQSASEYWVISVSDTGVGMTPQVKAKLFTPFFTTKEAAGTGLGLAMAYSITRQHGGFVDVTSEPDQGSTFFVYLPVARM